MSYPGPKLTVKSLGNPSSESAVAVVPRVLDVLLRSYCVQVTRVDAPPVAALMIYNRPRGYTPAKQLVRHPMSRQILVPVGQNPIPVFVD